MTRYSVYLEIDRSGCCMAHVLDFPGCTARGDSREQALGRLPAAIREAHAWLRRHAELAPAPDEPVELEVVEENVGPGPFNPGDAAALFTPDRRPLTRPEMERSFRLMAFVRADLLALVQDLPDRCVLSHSLDRTPRRGLDGPQRPAPLPGARRRTYIPGE